MRVLLSLAVLAVMMATASAAEPFRITVGESVAVEDADLVLTFVAVPRDSRCPRDVQCIVAGEAVVVFEVERDNTREELRFEVPPGGGDEQELEGLTIHLRKLEPETDSRRKIEPSEYIATIDVIAP